MKNNIFNFDHAFYAFIIMFILIFFVNYFTSSFQESIRAGLIQGILSFTIVGINAKIFEYLFYRTNCFYAIITPSIFTTTISLIIHTFNETPELIFSVLVVFIVAMMNFSFLSYTLKTHKKLKVKSIFRVYYNLIFKKK